jgi:hypothetical protein
MFEKNFNISIENSITFFYFAPRNPAPTSTIYPILNRFAYMRQHQYSRASSHAHLRRSLNSSLAYLPIFRY